MKASTSFIDIFTIFRYNGFIEELEESLCQLPYIDKLHIK